MTIISHCTLDTLRDAAKALRQGHLVIFPTETVYGLGGDAENEEAVRLIYETKGRPLDHPMIVHIGDLQLLDYWTSEVPQYAIALARDFWPGSMTLVLPRSHNARDFITGGQESVGIRIPAHPIALQLLKEFHSVGGNGIAAPSANRFGEVSPTSAEAAEGQLGPLLSAADMILDGGHCVVGIESTVIDCRGSSPRVLRPGAITREMIQQSTGLQLEDSNDSIRVSGSLESHYAPRARVLVGEVQAPGSGFVALSEVSTPPGMIRLAAPKDDVEYARVLYQSLREGDAQGLETIVIVPPQGEGLSEAIRDRIEKARTKGA